MTNGARLLKRGDTFDYECSRTTSRLRTAREILKAAGVEPRVVHSERTVVEFGREKHACDDKCVTIWPEWVTDDVFQTAYKLADEIIYESRSR